MALQTQWNKKKKRPPPGFDYVESVLEALENELRDIVKDTNLNKRKIESMWPIHQINWQKTRYIYDLFYKHRKISRPVYQYCLDQKLVDADLIAKWKKPGYENLCSTYVINPSNYKFGTTSICRVPMKDRNSDQNNAKDPTTGCLCCASGKGNPSNIFGNKYGQSLAAVQLSREQRRLEKLQQQQQQHQKQAEIAVASKTFRSTAHDDDDDDNDDDKTEEKEDDDDYGPSPTAGVWAGSMQLQQDAERLDGDDDGEAETEDEDEKESSGPRPPKRSREL